MNRTASIRRSLRWNLIDLLVILVLGALALSFLAERRAARNLSTVLLDQTLARVETGLAGFFDPVTRELSSLADRGAEAKLDVDDAVGLNQILGAFMRQHSWIVAARVADDRGREFSLQHTGDAWRSRRVLDPDGSRRVVWSDWLGDSSLATERDEILEYDPRTSPWFLGAALNAGSGEPHWTAAYSLPDSDETGFTASLALEGDGLTRVVALDVGLAEISAFTGIVRVAGQGGVFVLDEGDRLVALPYLAEAQEALTTAAALLQRPEDLDAGILRNAGATLLRTTSTQGPRRFSSTGASWWGQLRRYDLASRRPLWIVAVVPQAALVGDFAWQRRRIGALAAFLLGVAWLRAGWLATRWGDPGNPGATSVI